MKKLSISRMLLGVVSGTAIGLCLTLVLWGKEWYQLLSSIILCGYLGAGITEPGIFKETLLMAHRFWVMSKGKKLEEEKISWQEFSSSLKDIARVLFWGLFCSVAILAVVGTVFFAISKSFFILSGFTYYEALKDSSKVPEMLQILACFVFAAAAVLAYFSILCTKPEKWYQALPRTFVDKLVGNSYYTDGLAYKIEKISFWSPFIVYFLSLTACLRYAWQFLLGAFRVFWVIFIVLLSILIGVFMLLRNSGRKDLPTLAFISIAVGVVFGTFLPSALNAGLLSQFLYGIGAALLFSALPLLLKIIIRGTNLVPLWDGPDGHYDNSFVDKSEKTIIKLLWW